MIESWRNVWYMRSGSNTDPTFPFGFVQVRRSFFYHFFSKSIIIRYQQVTQQERLSEDFHGFVGIKHLMLVMYQIIRFRMYLWQLL
jgi:hypothetical protein